MIRFVCNCGRRLRARDEAALRRAICPSCGCPVGRSSTLDAAMRPKPLNPSERELPSSFAVVPLWNEGVAGAKTLPRYQVVSNEDTKTPPETNAGGDDTAAARNPGQAAARSERRRTRRRTGPLKADRKETLLFPFRCWRSIILLALLLAGSLGGGVIILVNVHLEPAPLTVILALAPAFVALVTCCAFWLVAFSATSRGEDSVIIGHSSFLRLFLVHVLRCLACFCALPVWILALAGYFWINAGEMASVDVLIVAELVLAAFLYWWLTLFAVTVDNSLRSMTPMGIVAAVRRLGIRPTLLATAAVVLALLFIGVPAALAFGSVPHNGWSLAPIGICCIALQIFLALLARSLGVACFLARINQPSVTVAASNLWNPDG